MADGKKKPSKLEAMRKAIKDKPAAKPKVAAAVTPVKVAAGEVAAAATNDNLNKTVAPKKPKKNYRTAKARDERANARGRLPVQTWIEQRWNGIAWIGSMKVWKVVSTPNKLYEELTLVKAFENKADGLFRMLEELDIMFWDWYTRIATDEEKGNLTFAPDPPDPEPWVNPASVANTEVEPH